MAVTPGTASSQSNTKLVDDINSRNVLRNAGWSDSAIKNMSDDQIINQLATLGENQYQRGERTKDRQETLQDFRSQLSDLTASKQRQAEQAGRIAQNNVKAQGLAQMMGQF
jgi:hypothetical protein